ncbi:MAG: hypothetical protein M3277_01525 [Actinomycetota bacterium]|nr:hypothetical protein [Actinomycetota bacterium]
MKLRRSAFYLCLAALLAAALLPVPNAAAASLQFSVKEGRAYAYKASLNRDVVRNLPPRCDPATDPYECDEGRYNHKPNCPKGIEIGPEGKAPDPKPRKDVTPTEGGAGDETGGQEPPQSSPVRFNRMMSLGSLSHLGGAVKEAAGLASDQYIDLSGRGQPEAHTESQAFSPNKASWEERCFPKQENSEDANDYTHVMSRSKDSVATYHLARCYRRACNFQAPTPGTFGASAERAESIVELAESGSQVVGELSAIVEDVSWGDGQLKIESIETHLAFSSDGTSSRLRWSVTSTASGARFAGQPISLPPGQVVNLPGMSVGVAAPYVEATSDGSQLTMVAPGLMVAHSEQSAFFGGAELYASFGETAGGLSFGGGPEIDPGAGPGDVSGSFGSSVGFGGGSVDIGGPGLSGGIAIGSPTSNGTEPVATGGEELLVYRQATGRGTVAGLLALGFLGWLLLLGRWLQRFSWGRRIFLAQPFRLFDWIYRAFIKT